MWLKVLCLPFSSASHSASVFYQSSEIHPCSPLNSGTKYLFLLLFPWGCVSVLLVVQCPCFYLFKGFLKVLAYKVEHLCGLELNYIVPILCCEILFFFSIVCRRKSMSALTSLPHCHLFEILLFKLSKVLYFLRSIPVSGLCMRSSFLEFPSLSWLSPFDCHLQCLFCSQFCEIVLIPHQPCSSRGRAFLLWWVSFGMCWAPVRCHCPYLYTPHTWIGIHSDWDM